ncbi:MAG: hypothetical protein AAFR59_16330, partial [Bacteroidota bacterium]
MEQSYISIFENRTYSYFEGPQLIPIQGERLDSMNQRTPYKRPPVPLWRQKLEDTGHTLKKQGSGLWIAYPPSLSFEGYRYMRSAPFTAYNENGDTVLHYAKHCPYLPMLHGGEDYLMLILYPQNFAHANPVIQGMYGFITEDGEMVIPPIYGVGDAYRAHTERGESYVWEFSFRQGRSLVEEGDHSYYYINRKGERVFPLDSTFYRAYHFEDWGLAMVQHINLKSELIDQVVDTSGQIVWDTKGHPEWQKHMGLTSRNRPHYFVSCRYGTPVMFMDDKRRKSALFPASDDSVRYLPRIAYLGSKSYDHDNLDENLLVTIERTLWKAPTPEERRSMQVRGYDGKVYTDWIPLPPGASLDPYAG